MALDVSLSLVVIEDHEALREGLVLLLEQRDCTVLATSPSAREGVELIVRHRPDVALVDIRLRDGDGIALTRTVLAANPAQRIVLYTGLSDEELLFDGLDSGAQGYAPKERPPEDLLTALRTVAGGGTYVDARLRAELLSERATRRLPTLTRRECEILDLLSRGMNGEAVAEHLVLSAETVKTHVRNAMNKLEASTRVHAIAIALREGYIEGPERTG